MFILTDPQQVAPPNLLLLMWTKTTFHKEFLFFFLIYHQTYIYLQKMQINKIYGEQSL